MIIVRGTNSFTGEVFEINSNGYPELKRGKTDLQILSIAAITFEEWFEGTDCDIDGLEVVAK